MSSDVWKNEFILEYYTQAFPELTVKASQIPWALDDGIGTMLPVMQSDITLSLDDNVLIIDAKYYAHTTQVQYNNEENNCRACTNSHLMRKSSRWYTYNNRFVTEKVFA